MEPQEILKFCLEKGLLIDKEVLTLFGEAEDTESTKFIISEIRNKTNSKIITRSVFEQNKETVNRILLELPEENREKLENFKIKLGLSIEIPKDVATQLIKEHSKEKLKIEESEDVRIVSPPLEKGKKLEVKDFVKYFRNRFNKIKGVLQERNELTNLTSINKISGNRQGISIIGIVLSKRITKNKNILLEIEDLTGKMRVLINQNKQDLYKKAENITLDAVIGVKGSGNKEIIFANDVFFPNTILPFRKNGNVEEFALFIGDLHFGSKKFLKENFLKFIDYLNGKVSDTPEVSKIKYLFIVGDLVTGVGNYPGQETDLEIVDLEEQFIELASLFSKIRSDIKIIISPGNHDGVRLMEPQPILNEKYAWPLYNLKNVILTTNPSTVNFGIKKNFSGFNVLIYHGDSYPYYADNISHLMLKKAMNSPEDIMKFLLQHRHLAPTHSSVQYFPSEKDPLFLETIPDIFVSGHTHKSGIAYYNNILLISTSCWEGLTSYQIKRGNKPDFCKVPMFNLKTRAVKILDFE